MPLIYLCLVILFLGCQQQALITHFQGNMHTHPYHIQIGHVLSQKEKEEVRLLLHEVFEKIDLYYNHWNPYSELSQINHLFVGETFPISSELLELIQKAQLLTKLTEGHFDPTYGLLTAAWKEALKSQTLPSSLEFLPGGWHTFTFEQGFAKRLIAGAQLDLDGLLKGFAIDQILEKLKEKGYTNLYVEWGGDMRATGIHPSGRSWKVALPGFEEYSLALDMALATSGTQEQSCEIEGKRYSHIVIPETKQATLALETVAVKGPSCLIADALATALMTYPSIEAALHYLDTHQGSFKSYTIWLHNNQGKRQKWESIVP